MTSPSSAPTPNLQKSSNNVTNMLAASESTTVRHADHRAADVSSNRKNIGNETKK